MQTENARRTVAPVEFDSLDRPITVTLAGVTTRFRTRLTGPATCSGPPASPRYRPQTVYYVDRLRAHRVAAAYEEKTYIGPSVAIYSRNGGNRDGRYLHLTGWGPPTPVTNAGGFEVIPDAHGFDAFGKPRGRDWQWPASAATPTRTTTRPRARFTGHEHLDDTYLIHMNGRVYDYRLGRFLSVDPIISNPANSQSINPYSYIGNNPLSGVDPRGTSLRREEWLAVRQQPTRTSQSKLVFANAGDRSPLVPAQAQTNSNGGGNTQTAALPSSNPSEANNPAQTAARRIPIQAVFLS